MFMDTVASFAVFAVIVILAIVSPAPLDAKADPNNTSFIPSPAWYFNALYALLEIVPEQFTLLATIVLPTLAVVVLILLPWIDRNPSRRLSRRPVVLGITAITMFGLVFMSFYGQNTISTKAAEAHQVNSGQAGQRHEQTRSTRPLPRRAAAEPQATQLQPQWRRDKKVYTASCAGCHGAAGAGVPGAFPPLAKNPDVIAADPKGIEHTVLYGKSGALTVSGATFNGQMPAWKGNLSNADIANVITFIRSSWGNTNAQRP